MRKREPGPGGRLQDVPSAWQIFLDSLPPNCLLLLVGGSPCNNLSRAGTHQGMDGLVGRLSWHFFATPLAAWTATRHRPYIYVHVLCENVHPVEDMHRDAMLEALGGLPADRAVILNAADWVASPRIRTWMATFGPPPLVTA